MLMTDLPLSIRDRALRDVPPRQPAGYVLYWMHTARRSSWNFALDRAVAWANALALPLLVLETLASDEPWACDRFHRFVLDGMRDNQQSFDACGIAYYPFIGATGASVAELVDALATQAALVVTERESIPGAHGVARVSSRVEARVEDVDTHGILPLEASRADQPFAAAYAFRRHLQRLLPSHLGHRPLAERDIAPKIRRPAAQLPARVADRWPRVASEQLAVGADARIYPIDHRVAPIKASGGAVAAAAHLEQFVEELLSQYSERHSHPDDAVTSALSPYLHFGHISAHQIVWRVLDHEGWTPSRLSTKASGAKAGWWGVSPSAEAFLDQIITWRELGFHEAAVNPAFDRYDALPNWARRTLETHRSDPRPHLYSLDQLDRGATHDPLWNAAQCQLRTEGRLHNYLRMLWGKKILEWTPSGPDALAVMIELNNRYALDGRDPNSYSGILWVLGRYDRPWPERPIFGTIRCMTSASTSRKLRVAQYLARYGPAGPALW